MERVEKELGIDRNIIQNLLDNTTDLMYSVDDEGKTSYANAALKSLLGYTGEEIKEKSIYHIIHSDSMHDFVNHLDNDFTGKKSLKKDFIFITKDKHSVICEGNIICDFKNGKRISSIGIFRDVTLKREAEEKVKIQTAKLNAIFQSSSYQIYTIDKNFQLTSFNQNYENEMINILGIKPEVGMDFRKVISDKRNAATLIKVWNKAFKGESKRFENKIIDKNGKIEWYETNLDPIFLSDGSIEELSFITRNITELKLSEEKIIHSLKEKEILLKEVHHRVKNNLQMISSIINLQLPYISDNNHINMLREFQNRISSMAFLHENLYQNRDFARVNFSEYIKMLSRNLKYSYFGLNNSVKLKFEITDILFNIDIAIPCGLILNELLSNSLKHAFPEGRTGEIFIKLSLEEEKVKLIVKDDGIGFPEEINYKDTASLGLQLVVTLVNQLNGDIKLERENGTKYNITFKQ